MLILGNAKEDNLSLPREVLYDKKTRIISPFFSNMTADQMLFTEKDLEKSMDKIETVHFHEVRLEKS